MIQWKIESASINGISALSASLTDQTLERENDLPKITHQIQFELGLVTTCPDSQSMISC